MDSNHNKNQTQNQSTWGKLRFGTSHRHSALTPALLGGLLISTLLSLILAHWGLYTQWVANFLFLFAAFTPATISLLWIILVDRSTIKNAVANPEQSIENTWLMRATSRSFFITFAGTGLASAITTIFVNSTVGTTLSCVTVTMMILLAITYIIEKVKA